MEFRRNGYLGRFNIGLLGSAFAETIVVAQDGKISNLEESDAKSLTVNYHGLKAVACDYAKSRVASGGLTKPPWASRIYLKSRVRCSIFIAPTLSAWVS